jgi:hypothetical protein
MARNGQGFMKNREANAEISRTLPVKADGHSKKLVFDQSAGVSAVRAKVST